MQVKHKSSWDPAELQYPDSDSESASQGQSFDDAGHHDEGTGHIGVEVPKKRKVSFIESVDSVEKVLRWKKHCGQPLDDVEDTWRDKLSGDILEGAVPGDEANPINVDEI